MIPASKNYAAVLNGMIQHKGSKKLMLDFVKKNGGGIRGWSLVFTTRNVGEKIIVPR